MHDYETITFSPDELTKDLFATQFRRVFPKYVGSGKPYSYKKLSFLTNIEVKTLQKYQEGICLPQFAKYMVLCSVLGHHFKNEIESIAGFSGSYKTDDAEKQSPQCILSKLTDVSAVLARHLMDGKVDHTELPEHKEALYKAHSAIGCYLSTLKGKHQIN